MATLDRWHRFLTAPLTLAFPRLELIGLDHEPSIVVGEGEVQMPSPSEFTFVLKGKPTDIGYALKESNRIRENPYDGLARLRLIGTDADGVEWNGGWTIPRIDPRGGLWTFSGEIESLSTLDRSASVSSQASVELMFLLRIGDPMTVEMARFVRTKRPDGKFNRQHTLKILGSELTFDYQDDKSVLALHARCSSELPHPYCENWISEPMRILFGQLIYPRLVARNFDDGRSMVWLRRSPNIIRGASWAALWTRENRMQEDSVFWSRFAQLLSMIAYARVDGGEPNFEPHKITRLYEEVILASRGSRWVWALTFASAIEAIVNMIKVQNTPKLSNENDVRAAQAMIDHINNAAGDERLKSIAIGALRRSLERTPIRVMRDLQQQGIISKEQLSAWENVRHSVMHGSLLSNYSNEEEDKRLLALSSMMHALTNALLRQTML